MGVHDDGVHRAAIPDMLVGIGGAGKRIVSEFMRTDWILEEAIEPRGDHPAPDVQAYVVDTDGDQRSTDEQVAAEINDHIRALADEFGRHEPALGTSFEYINPLDALGPDLQRPSALVQPAPVTEFAGDLGAWWLDESDEMLVDGYQEGVIRRRALGKAIFHASTAGPGENPLTPVLDPAVSEAYIVVGLGGGTGSGMFLDVAREMAENVDALHLFGVIPASGENDRNLANAHAALSELEYLSRTGNNPFETVVLLPFGGLEDRTSDSERREFDEAAVNAIMAHQSIPVRSRVHFLGTNARLGLPDYAPFTVAVPQILRYSAGDAEQANSQVQEFVSTRLEALHAEHELYDALEDYITTQFAGEDAAESLEAAIDGVAPPNDRFSLTGAQAAALRDRFDTLVELLDEDVLGALSYDPALDWADRLAHRVEDVTANTEEGVERNEAIVMDVPRVVDQVDDPAERYTHDPRHQDFDEFVQRELRAIRRRANLFRAVSLVEDDDLAEGIEEDAMDPDIPAISPDIADELDVIEHRLSDIETDLDRLDAFESDLRATATRARDEWLLDVRPTLDDIEAVDRHRDAVVDRLDELEAEIENTVAEIEATARPEELRDVTLSFDRFDELNHRLDEVGLSPIEPAAIERSVDAIRRAKRAKMAADRTGPLRRLLFGVDDHRAEFEGMVGQVDHDLFSVSTFDEPFYAKFTGDIRDRAGDVDRLDDHRSALADEVVDSFERRFADPPIDRETFDDEVGDALHSRHPYLSWPGDIADAPQALRDRLEVGFDDESVDAFLDAVGAGDVAPDESAPVNAGFWGAVVEPVASLRDDIERERDRLLAEHERYDHLVDIIDDEGDRFFGVAPAQRRLDVEFGDPLEKNQYINRIDAEETPQLLGSENLVEAGLHEEEHIGALLREFADNVARADGRFPLHEGTLALDPTMIPEAGVMQRLLYDHHNILPVFMGRAFAEKTIADYDLDGEIEMTLRSAIAAQDGHDGYNANTCRFGGPWDTSLVTFVGGVFLDNLRPVREAAGYYDRYLEQRDELAERIRVCHAYGLDGLDRTMVDEDGKGAYVYRDSLVDLDGPDELLQFIDADEEERGDLFANKTSIDVFESTIDLGE
jgi:hypothetical protein